MRRQLRERPASMGLPDPERPSMYPKPPARSRPAVVLLLAALGVGCGGGGVGGGGEETPFVVAAVGTDLDGVEGRAVPPVTVSFSGLPSEVVLDDVVRFRVSARVRAAAVDERITIALQNPPPGCLFPTASGDGSTFAVSGRWIVNSANIGLHRLSFRIVSSSQGVFRKSLTLRVVSRRLPSGTRFGGPGILTGDVTGDGLLDVVALATSHGPDDRGAVYVFAGSTQPAVEPTAILVDGASGATGDRLGFDVDATLGQPVPLVFLVDVTGDGVLDVVAAAPGSDRFGVDEGAIFVWAGGAGLMERAPVPTRILRAGGIGTLCRLGSSDAGPESIVFADVIGSSALDILVASTRGQPGGAILVYEGGDGLGGGTAGTVLAPTSFLMEPFGGDVVTIGSDLAPIRVADLTGDGKSDVIASSRFIFPGAVTLPEFVTPAAILSVNMPSELSPLILGVDLRLGDVSGDGVTDIVAHLGSNLGVLGVPLAGLGCVWLGRPAFSGSTLPDHLLTVPTPLASDQQGQQVGVFLRDVTGDGTLDILTTAPTDGTREGEIRLWKGGSLAGSRPDPIRLRGATPVTKLGTRSRSLQPPFVFGDVTGDGIEDVLVEVDASISDAAAGARMWRGGPNLDVAPGTVVPSTATLEVDEAAFTPAVAGRHGVQVEDLDGDGDLDVVVEVRSSDDRPSKLRIWKGGASLAGVAPANVTILAPLSQALGGSSADGTSIQAETTHLVDVDRDGRPDVLVTLESSPASTTASVARAFLGATIFDATILGAPPEFLNFATGDIRTHEALPRSGIHGLVASVQVADVNGDGEPEIVGAVPTANVGGIASGCVYLWNATKSLADQLGRPVHRLRGNAVAGSNLPIESRGPQGVILADITGDGVVEVLVGDPIAARRDGEITFVGGGVPFPTSTGGFNGRFFGGTFADGLTR